MNILREEMKRTQRFYVHYRDLWMSRSSMAGTLPVECGAAAFASKYVFLMLNSLAEHNLLTIVDSFLDRLQCTMPFWTMLANSSLAQNM